MSIPKKVKRTGKYFRIRQDHKEFIEQEAKRRNIDQQDLIDEAFILLIDRNNNVKEQNDS